MVEKLRRLSVPQIGDMPQPSYIAEINGIRWIGMTAFDINLQSKVFLWWRNIAGDLNQEETRVNAAKIVAQLKLEMDTDAAIGLPIDLQKSDPNTNQIETNIPGLYGVYIVLNERKGFSIRANLIGIDTADIVEKKYPELFREIFQKAKKVLPKI